MNPCDALQQDWRMYYDGSWMRHKKYGPGQIQVDGQALLYYNFGDNFAEIPTPIPVSAKDLECWWPRSGAHNTPQGAIYIVRRATRSMRKSAHPAEHYRIKWGSQQAMHQSSIKTMIQLRKGFTFIDFEFAMKAIKEGMTSSVAITRDIIIAAAPTSGYKVIYRGIHVGKMREDKFTATHPKSAIARRTRYKLEQEGIL